MRKTEVVKLLKFLNSYYNSKFEYPRSEEADNKILQETWLLFLEEYDYPLVRTAVKKIVLNNDWPPTPGEIIKEIETIKLPAEDKLSAGEAWSLVLDVIGKYGTSYNYKKAVDFLPPKVLEAAKCVGGLQAIGRSSENDTYLMNAFLQAYKNINVREREEKLLPGSVRQEVKLLADHFKNKRQVLLEDKGEDE